MEDKSRASKKPRGGADSGLTAFALRLAKQLAGDANAGGKNLVFSPVSIYSALSLVAAGARGATLNELLAVLGAASREELAEFVCGVADSALADRAGGGGPLVSFAWALWHEKTVVVKPGYHAIAAESYKAEIRAADFIEEKEEAIDEINNWVSKATKQLITSILSEDSVSALTRIVLVNAIYFKGAWVERFSPELTEERSFYCLDDTDVRVPFMRSKANKQFVATYDDFSVLKLPYSQAKVVDEGSDDERPQFSMVIFLPDEYDGLPGLVDEMASRPSFLWDHLPEERVRVGQFRLPKFKLSFSRKFNDVLKAMGIKAAFDEDMADLTDMLEEEAIAVPLVVETVMHKAVIEVNEEGTEAAASTACSSRKKQCASLSVDFVADHPFVFFVVEEVSRTIIFMGHVLDPSESE